MAINLGPDPNQKRNDLLKELKGSGSLPTLALVRELMDELAQEYRIRNDEARGDDLLVNQGKVQMCKEVKNFLTFSQ